MCIYNCDESALTTVHTPPKVIANKNAKQVVSAERDTLVTMCGAVNALGNSIPPFLVFPRVHFKSYMINNAPPGTAGVAYFTGWMTAESFELWMEHFFKHSKSSKEHPVLLLLDNHQSHVSVNISDKAKESGVVMVTFPPHTSHSRWTEQCTAR